MTDLAVTAANFHVVEAREQASKPAAVAITAGQWMKEDSNGKWALALATTAANAGRRRAIAAKTVAAGETVSGVYKGVVDPGGAVDSLAFDAQVFLSDTSGTMADAAGTVSTVVGVVTSGWASGATADKLLRIDN